MNKVSSSNRNQESWPKFLKKMLGDGLILDSKKKQYTLKKNKTVITQYFFLLTKVQPRF